ncbi:MAG TPA: hypothetical protein VM285_10225 [Polyangia bacterium]|nr:hypothetical protein [Polyangia bacterium]
MGDTPSRVPAAQPPTGLLTALTLLAGMAVAGGAVAALVVLVSEERTGQVTTEGIILSAGCLVIGVLVGCVLWVVTYAVRRQSRLSLLQLSAQRTLQQRQSQPFRVAEPEPVGPESPGPDPPVLLAPEPEEEPIATELVERVETDPSATERLLRALLRQVQELNDNLLMSDAQRETKRGHRHEKLARRFSEEIDSAIAQGDFELADMRLEAFRERAPDETTCEALRTRIEAARTAAKQEDVRAQTQRIYDLMAVSDFDGAEKLARHVQRRYPGDAELEALVQRVLREGKMFRGERRDRMYREVTRKAEARQWRAALEAARQFVEAFPGSVDADAIRAMMPTIEDNARIEEVRGLRDHIRDLIERRRYAEAVEAAEDILRRFPDTRAAVELGRQLNRLRQLARGPSSI